MTTRAHFTPRTVRLLQLALTLLVVVYMLLAGGTFDASLRYRVQLLNTVAAGALAAAWLAARWRAGARLALTGLEWPLAAFVLSQWVAVAFSQQPQLGLEWAAGMAAWAAMLLIAFDLLEHGWHRAGAVNALFVVAAFVAAQGLVEAAAWYAGWARLGQWPPFNFRLNGFLGHANLTAAVLNLLLPIVIAQALAARSWPSRAALAALAAAMLAAAFFTSSRSGWLAAAVALGTLALLLAWRGQASAWHSRWRAASRPARLLVGAGAVLVMVVAGWLLARQAEHATHSPLFQSRTPFWGPAWAQFLADPLTGAGPDLFPWLYPAYYSIPPTWFAPHAHSLALQVLSGSGLLGLGALLTLAGAAAVALWRRWQAARDPHFISGAMAGLAGLAFQHLFDYLFGNLFLVFLVVLVMALALSTPRASSAPAGATRSQQRSAHPAWVLPLLLVPLGVFAYALRASAAHEAGLEAAARGEWATAGAHFEQAAQSDPALSLYWQEAAYAYTRAGDVARALPLWQHAATADPYWALPMATLGVLAHDRAALQAAVDLAPNAYLYHLNLGMLAEAEGDAAAAEAAYARALDLAPARAAALFWQQSPLRQGVLLAWQAEHDPGESPLALGWRALAAGDAAGAAAHFEQAQAANPENHDVYEGLARAYWAMGDEARAEQALRAGLRLPVIDSVEDILGLRLLEGEWAAAHGDRRTAMDRYTQVFSAINDYGVLGVGTYAYPQRYWYVYHRHTLPADLVPQLARADITAATDARFAELAGWFFEDGQPATACLVLARVHREAPVSQSGALWVEACEGRDEE